jgi:hypothetical protein
MRVVLRTLAERTELRAARDAPEAPVRRNVTIAPARGVEAILTARS